MINNVVYAVKECKEPFFMLKTELDKSLEEMGNGQIASATVRECMKFEGKYYAYYRIEQKGK